jgi:hypothetical protein
MLSKPRSGWNGAIHNDGLDQEELLKLHECKRLSRIVEGRQGARKRNPGCSAILRPVQVSRKIALGR